MFTVLFTYLGVLMTVSSYCNVGTTQSCLTFKKTTRKDLYQSSSAWIIVLAVTNCFA